MTYLPPRSLPLKGLFLQGPILVPILLSAMALGLTQGCSGELPENDISPSPCRSSGALNCPLQPDLFWPLFRIHSTHSPRLSSPRVPSQVLWEPRTRRRCLC